MNDFFKVCPASEISPGGFKKFDVNGTPMLVVNLGGDFFAINDLCTHQQCSLSDGWVEGEEIVCPCHGGKFEIKTGKATQAPAVVDDKTYEVKIENNEIWIKT